LEYPIAQLCSSPLHEAAVQKLMIWKMDQAR